MMQLRSELLVRLSFRAPPQNHQLLFPAPLRDKDPLPHPTPTGASAEVLPDQLLLNSFEKWTLHQEHGANAEITRHQQLELMRHNEE